MILSRELSRDPAVPVIAQPTLGLDIGAVEFIRERIAAAHSNGTAVLLFSEDLDERISLP